MIEVEELGSTSEGGESYLQVVDRGSAATIGCRCSYRSHGGGRTSTVQEARLLTSWVSSKFLLALFIMALIQTY